MSQATVLAPSPPDPPASFPAQLPEPGQPSLIPPGEKDNACHSVRLS